MVLSTVAATLKDPTAPALACARRVMAIIAAAALYPALDIPSGFAALLGTASIAAAALLLVMNRFGVVITADAPVVSLGGVALAFPRDLSHASSAEAAWERAVARALASLRCAPPPTSIANGAAALPCVSPLDPAPLTTPTTSSSTAAVSSVASRSKPAAATKPPAASPPVVAKPVAAPQPEGAKSKPAPTPPIARLPPRSGPLLAQLEELSAHAAALVRSVPASSLPHAERIAQLMAATPARAAVALTSCHLIVRIIECVPMLFDYQGTCVADIGPAPADAQAWYLETVRAQRALLPAILTDPLRVPLDIAVVPASLPPDLLAPLVVPAAASRVIPVMLVTDGANITGGRGKQREQLLRRHGATPTVAHVFDASELEERRVARAAVIASRRARRADKAQQVALITLLSVEGRNILTEVHHSGGWAADRWVPWVFPTHSLHSPVLSPAPRIEAPPSFYLTADTLPIFLSAAPAEWLDILERIAGFAEASPLGMAGAFSCSALERIDSSIAFLHSARAVRPRLREVLVRLGVLRRRSPSPVTTPLETVGGLLPRSPLLPAPIGSLSPDSDSVAVSLDREGPLAPPPPLPASAPTLPVAVARKESRGALYARLAKERHARAFGLPVPPR